MKFPKVSSGLKKYFSNTSWLFFERVLKMIVTLIVGIYVARYLGPDRYGQLNYAISFILIITPIAALGLEQIVIRNLVDENDKHNEILGTALLLKLMAALLLLGLLLSIFSFSSADRLSNILVFIIAFSLVFQALNVIDFFFRAIVMSKFAVYARSVSMLAAAVLKVLFILLKKDLVYLAAVLSVESLVLALGLVCVYKKQNLRVSDWRFSLEQARDLLGDSWPLLLSGVAVSVYMRIDQVMIKNLIDNAAVGNYAVAVRLSEAWYFIPTIITSSLFPAIVNAKGRSEALYQARLQRLYALMTWLALAISVPVSFLAGDIIRVMFGSQYQAASVALRLYIWSSIFVFLGSAGGKYLVTENFTRISFVSTFTGTIVNVALNLIFIPKYGISGAAMATIVSYAMPIFIIAVLPKTRGQAMLMLKSLNIFLIWRINRLNT